MSKHRPQTKGKDKDDDQKRDILESVIEDIAKEAEFQNKDEDK